MNTNLRNAARNDFEKDFFKLMRNLVFWKTMKNIWKHRDIRLITTEKKLLGVRFKLSYYKVFLENLLVMGMRKTQIHMNKHVYLS